MLLKNKVAIITGAASARGLGRATAKLFAEQGAKVVIADLDEQASIDAANALPGEGHLGVAINVADEIQVQAAKEKILAKYGRIDVLVNNAGITQPLKVMDIIALPLHKTENHYDSPQYFTIGTKYCPQSHLAFTSISFYLFFYFYPRSSEY